MGSRQVDDVSTPVELNAETRWITISTGSEPFERRADRLIDRGRFSCETFPRIAPTGQTADLEPERVRVVAVAELDADAVLAVVEDAVVLPAT
jgi:hypothetical protein